jgi:glutaconate CoA-transferase, subunit A
VAARPDKRMSLGEAVAEFVHDGDTVYLGGFLQMDPMAAVHELIRQGKSNLTISKAAGLLALDLLLGAGCAERAITSYVWNPLPRPAHGFLRAVQKGTPRRVALEEYSLLSLSLAYLAGALGLPYVPSRTLLGSDLLARAPRKPVRRLRAGRDPFSGQQIVRIAPLCHDVGIVQVQRADPQGNAQTWGFLGDTSWGILSCKRIVVCAERIVPHDLIRRDPDRTLIPAFRTSAVVRAPFGAHPLYVAGCYEMDWPFLEYYEQETRTEAGFSRFLEQWILATRTHQGYLKRLGTGRLHALKPRKRWQAEPVSYGRFPAHAWAAVGRPRTPRVKREGRT